ncbi:MAG: hypothetical protein ACLQBL_16735 [Polyangiaceae bacterium]
MGQSASIRQLPAARHVFGVVGTVVPSVAVAQMQMPPSGQSVSTSHAS